MSSFAEQYGIRLGIEEISWPEYHMLFTGISGDTALGRIIQTRSETDPNMINSFTSEQRKIRREWIARKNRENPEAAQNYLASIENMFKAMCSKG